jgi:hypothetical protein
MLDNSGYITLDNEHLFVLVSGDREQCKKIIDGLSSSRKKISLEKLINWESRYGRVKYVEGGRKKVLQFERLDEWKDCFLHSNYSFVPLLGIFRGWKKGVYYIWSILFSQLVLSILMGVVLQLLWEDRPITEPL